MRPKVVLFSLVLCVLLPAVGVAQLISHPFWSVGPKLGYNFKERDVAYGVEITYVPVSPRAFFYGYTFDFTAWPTGNMSFHLGLEGWLIFGLDIGPTLFLHKKETLFGLSGTVWDGAYVIPYYEVGIPFGGDVTTFAGGYLKFPIGFKDAFGSP